MNLKMSAFCLVISASSIFITHSILAQDIPPATTQQQAIAYAHAAEVNPLAPEADQQRKAAMNYDQNDHTSHVLLCQSVFTQMVSNKHTHGHDISLQMVISAAAFLYEHPENATDSIKQNVAGLNAALNVYQKFLAFDPTTRTPFYDKLLKKRDEGKLEKAVAGMCH